MTVIFTTFLVKVYNVQNYHFIDDIRALKAGKTCSSALRKLSPFLDGELLPVGGRLQNASLHFDQQRPLLLPAKDRVVQLLVEHYHTVNLHYSCPSLLLAILRQKYWITYIRPQSSS